KVTDAGLSCLSSFSKLRWLQLSSSKVTDEGLVHLAGMTNLEVLGLSGTSVPDIGLAELQKVSVLRSLDLNDTKVTAAGLASFHQELRNCQVYWEPPIEDDGTPRGHAKRLLGRDAEVTVDDHQDDHPVIGIRIHNRDDWAECLDRLVEF